MKKSVKLMLSMVLTLFLVGFFFLDEDHLFAESGQPAPSSLNGDYSRFVLFQEAATFKLSWLEQNKTQLFEEKEWLDYLTPHFSGNALEMAMIYVGAEKVTEEEFAHIHEIMTSFKDLETNDLYPTLVSDDPDSKFISIIWPEYQGGNFKITFIPNEHNWLIDEIEEVAFEYGDKQSTKEE
ncbi:hypothetical protein BTS2_1867 [Bacillus sp. TS-2]|nr:hypothetical protein BTS2_1867 [Bacillus sp. TS-2]